MRMARAGFRSGGWFGCYLHLPGLFVGYGMRPRFAEAEACRSCFGVKFGGSFDDGAEWITHFTGILPVGVINAPELVGS